MANILVTGGAGYVGSHACKLLASKGMRPVTFDSLRNGHREAVRWGPLVIGDIRDKTAVRNAIVDYKVEAVFHFAALAYVADSVAQPDTYYDVNVIGTLKLLEAMRETSVKRLIFSSSCATYGIPDVVPIDEDHPQRPINPYGRTKLICEQILADYARAFGFSHAVLRYFNAAGCDPEGDLFEKHVPEPHLIPRALMAAAGIGPPLQINGSDYETPDGTAIRDFIHASDLATAHWLAFDQLNRNAAPIVLNLGTGRGFSVRQVIDMVQRITGRAVPTNLGPRRPGDPPVLIASTRLAAEAIRFQPEYSDLETLILTAWKGIRSIY
ncbi:UDP-glucose 4-epimerase GalE [Taklimakanibacter lacteus]|uniref:UDP-glucose 4-epimerase GalE n=1 Tax=Taklimakanibacter lacteus TaxID=2268456 RepID=UPI000E674E7D